MRQAFLLITIIFSIILLSCQNNVNLGSPNSDQDNEYEQEEISVGDSDNNFPDGDREIDIVDIDISELDLVEGDIEDREIDFAETDKEHNENSENVDSDFETDIDQDTEEQVAICDDSICEGRETCLTCPEDCGQCADDCTNPYQLAGLGVQYIEGDLSKFSNKNLLFCDNSNSNDIFFNFSLSEHTAIIVQVIESDTTLQTAILANCPAENPGDGLLCSFDGNIEQVLTPGDYTLLIEGSSEKTSGYFKLKISFVPFCDYIDCDDNESCTTDTCNSDQGKCEHAALADDTDCLPANPTCVKVAKCTDASCELIEGIDCDDQNSLTEDFCDDHFGCRHRPANNRCIGAEEITTTGTQTISADMRFATDDNHDYCTSKGQFVDLFYHFNLTEPTAVSFKQLAGSYHMLASLFKTCKPENWWDVFMCEVDQPEFVILDAGDYYLVLETLSTYEYLVEYQLEFASPCEMIDCDDQNPCTNDVCNLQTFECTNKPIADGSDCELENLICIENMQCDGGDCTGGNQIDCSDSAPLTVDVCDSDRGCLHRPANDLCENADEILQTSPQIITGDTSQASSNDSQFWPCPYYGHTGNDLFYKFTLNQRMAISLSLGSSNFMPMIAIYSTCDITSDDDIVACAYPPPSSGDFFEVLDVGEYFLVVDSRYDDIYGEFEFEIKAEDPCLVLSCDDDNPCTSDSCDETLRQCVHEPLADNTTCTLTGNLCVETYQCISGTCEALNYTDCDDSDNDTLDECKPDKGCLHHPIGDSCDRAIEIVASEVAVLADDTTRFYNANPYQCQFAYYNFSPDIFYHFTLLEETYITTETINAFSGMTLGIWNTDCPVDVDGHLGCAYLGNDISASYSPGEYFLVIDGEYDESEAGQFEVNLIFGNACTHLDCDDQNPCTTDTCNTVTQQCENVSVQDYQECQTGNQCLTNEQCISGVCSGGTAVDCDDSDFETYDTCSVESGCINYPHGDVCDFTIDLAAEGTYTISGDTSGFYDNNTNYCTYSYFTGQTPDLFYHFRLLDTSFVRIEELSGFTGIVLGLFNTCPPTEDQHVLDCSEHDINQALIEGIFTPGHYYILLDGHGFDSNIYEGAYQLELEFSTPCGHFSCDDQDPCTDDICDAQTGLCEHPPATNGTSCNTENLCIQNQSCLSGICQGGEQITCNDDDPSTIDRCYPEQGCYYHLQGDFCTNPIEIDPVGTKIIFGDTHDFTNQSSDECPLLNSGQDVIYHIKLEQPMQIRLDFTSPFKDLFVGFYDECPIVDESPRYMCKKGASTANRFLTAGDYYIKVDDYYTNEESGGEFRLELEFTAWNGLCREFEFDVMRESGRFYSNEVNDLIAYDAATFAENSNGELLSLAINKADGGHFEPGTYNFIESDINAYECGICLYLETGCKSEYSCEKTFKPDISEGSYSFDEITAEVCSTFKGSLDLVVFKEWGNDGYLLGGESICLENFSWDVLLLDYFLPDENECEE